MRIEDLAAPGVQKLTAYDPGYDPETIRRMLGLPRMRELGSNGQLPGVVKSSW